MVCIFMLQIKLQYEGERSEETGRNCCIFWYFDDFSALRLQAFAAENCSTTPTPPSSRLPRVPRHRHIETSTISKLFVYRHEGFLQVVHIGLPPLMPVHWAPGTHLTLWQTKQRQCRLRIDRGRLREWVDLFFLNQIWNLNASPHRPKFINQSLISLPRVDALQVVPSMHRRGWPGWIVTGAVQRSVVAVTLVGSHCSHKPCIEMLQLNRACHWV